MTAVPVDDAPSLDPRVLAPDGRCDLQPTSAGELSGCRVVVKDLLDVAGRVTAAGNPTLAGGPPAGEHAEAVRRVLAAGGRVVGKVATDELAMGMFGVNAHYGTPPNPAAPGRVPGGSSSGSASAVAAGAADIGLGTDTGGSIRVPAGFCGLVGIRTTHGRVPVRGVRPMAADFDTVGLLGRDPVVVRAGLRALLDPPSGTGARSRPGRLVVCTDLTDRADAEVAAATRRVAADWARACGWTLHERPLLDGTDPEQLVATFWPLMSRGLWEANGAWVSSRRPVLGTGIAERVRAAGEVGDDAVERARAERARLRREVESVLAPAGAPRALAVLPTSVGPAPRADLAHADLMAYRDRNLPQVVLASLLGAPQLSLPAADVAVAEGRVPAGISLLGLPGDDELLVDLAVALCPVVRPVAEATP